MPNPFVEDMLAKIKAGYAATAIDTTEPGRCLFELKQAGWLMGQDRRVTLSAQDRAFFRSLFEQYPDHGHLAGAHPAGAHLAKDAPPRKGGSRLEGNDIVVDVPSLLGVLQTFQEDSDQAKAIRNVLDGAGYPLVTWMYHQNFDRVPGDFELDRAMLTAALKYDKSPKDKALVQLPPCCLIAFLGGDEFLNADGLNGMRFRQALEWVVDEERLVNESIRRLLFFVQEKWSRQSRVNYCLHIVEFPPPSPEQLDSEITFVENSLRSSKPGVVLKCPAAIRDDVVTALRGFTRMEAVNALSYCTVRHGGFAPEMVKTLHRLKAETLKRDEVLEYIDADYLTNAEDIGGYEVYLEYIAEAKECYSKESRDAGIPRPKGVLLFGLPGTGKSMVAAATAKLMQLPLVKYDFGAVFGGIVGESEATQRRVLSRVMALGPCVLFVDEADKAFAGMSHTVGDSGVGQRVFGRLLSWMATENKEAFLIMTMNRPADVPIEMLRSGRLDSIWYTTFPGPEERLDILKIHLRKNHAGTGSFSPDEWKELAAMTEDFVGSELEQLVLKAVRTSWKREHSTRPAFEDLRLARQSVNPVAYLDKDGMEAIQKYCEGKATPVSRERRATALVRPGGGGGGRRRGNVQVDPPESN
jgi:hypothetical protein